MNPPAAFAVLGCLLPGPAHGYEIGKRLSLGLGPIWRIAPSQLYSLLARLEREGLIRGHLEPQGARPPRRVFSLTPAGRHAFWDWATSPVRHARDVRLELLAKLYFLHRHAPDQIPPLLSAQAKRLARLRNRLAGRAPLPSDDPWLGRVALDFRLRQLEGLISWLEETNAVYRKEVAGA